MKINMKINMKTIFAGIVMATIALSGCGGDNVETSTSNGVIIDSENFPAVLDLINKAQTTMSSLDSVKSIIDVEIDMEMMGQSMLTQTKTNIATFTNPTKMDLSIDITSADGQQSAQMYIEEIDNEISSYIEDGGEWIQQIIPREDLMSLQANLQAVEILPNIIDPFIIEGVEEDGLKIYTIEGFLDHNSMLLVAELNGTTATAEMLGMSAEDVEGIISTMDNTEVILAIDENGYIHAYYVDMFTMLQGIMSISMEQLFGMPMSEMDEMGMGLIVNKASVSTRMSEFNEVSDFTIPEEVY